MGWDSITPTKPAELSEFANEAVQNPVQLMPEAVKTANLTDDSDRELAAIVALWPTLSTVARASVLALAEIKSTEGGA